MNEQELAAQAEEAAAADAAAQGDSHDDPIKRELDKVQKAAPTKRDRMLFARKKIDEQLAEFDDEAAPTPDGDDDEPLTIGKFKDMQKLEGKKKAVELAESIEDEHERELTKHYLANRIVPSGNAEEDLKLARAAVNSLRNAQVAEELARKPQPRTNSSASGVPAKREVAFEPTAEERVFMSPPYSVTKEEILKAREKTEQE